MAGEKVSLADLADACEEMAERERGFLEGPLSPADFEWRRKRAAMWDGGALIFRVMGTYEERSRKFIAELLGEHGR